MKVLFLNACARENSRTMVLAEEVLKNIDGEIKEIDLFSEDLRPLDAQKIATRLNNQQLQMYAKEFSLADVIVIAAPLWDLSFPALLKTYIENVTIAGITFKYTENGPVGLCKAEKLYYISTSGGKFVADYGYEYIKGLALNLFGIKETKCFYAEDLDIWGNDDKTILEKSIKEISDYFIK